MFRVKADGIDMGLATTKANAKNMEFILKERGFQSVTIEKIKAPTSYAKKIQRKARKAGPVKVIKKNPVDKTIPAGTVEVVEHGKTYKVAYFTRTSSEASSLANNFDDAIIRKYKGAFNLPYGVFVAGSLKKNPSKKHSYYVVRASTKTKPPRYYYVTPRYTLTSDGPEAVKFSDRVSAEGFRKSLIKIIGPSSRKYRFVLENVDIFL